MSEKSMLTELVRLAGDHARRIMIDGQQPLMASWVYIDHDGLWHIVGTPWRDETEKELMIAGLRATMRREKAVAYSLVVEAWTARAPEDWKPGEAIDVMPRDRPDHVEAVIAFATDGETIEWKRWDTKRDWTERVVALEERPFDGSHAESWMTQLLSKPSKRPKP